MKWSVSLTVEVDQWFLALADSDGVMADRVEAAINVLADTGPSLGRPLVDKISASRHHNMKELRIGSIRILFAFDPLSEAILLLAGDKAGAWSKWYLQNIPIADRRLDEHLEALRSDEHGN